MIVILNINFILCGVWINFILFCIFLGLKRIILSGRKIYGLVQYRITLKRKFSSYLVCNFYGIAAIL